MSLFVGAQPLPTLSTLDSLVGTNCTLTRAPLAVRNWLLAREPGHHSRTSTCVRVLCYAELCMSLVRAHPLTHSPRGLSLSLCLSLWYASAVLSACLQSKSDFAAVNGTALLEGIASLSIQSWRYKTQPESVRHIGPTAQDFHRIFGGYGESNTRISTVDVSQGQFVHTHSSAAKRIVSVCRVL